MQDLNITVARFWIIETDFEPRNDNANPFVTDYDAFDRSALPLEWMRRLKAESAIDKYILTVWAPPAWMKKAAPKARVTGSGENFVEERYYEEYAGVPGGDCAGGERRNGRGTVRHFRAERAAVQPALRCSALLPADKMAQVLVVTARRFAAEAFRPGCSPPKPCPSKRASASTSGK